MSASEKSPTMNALTKILSAAGAAACLATSLAASAQPADFHHDEWRGRGVHERVWRDQEWRGHEWRGQNRREIGWRDASWREDWRYRRGWSPAFYGMPAPVIYDAPDYGPEYAPAPVAYEGPPVERRIAEQRVYERPTRIVRIIHHHPIARHAVHRAAFCAVPAHRR
jgi:hypothetical protein